MQSDIEPPKFIDANPREHSSSYELKPMSRWWLAPILAYIALCLWVMGWLNWQAWACIFAGLMLGLTMIMVFPRFWLSKINDQR